MADNPITVSLPADLPTDWNFTQTISPNGTEAGLSEQHGYNYLMRQVNAAQIGLLQAGEALLDIGKPPSNYSALLLPDNWGDDLTQTVQIPGILPSDTAQIIVAAPLAGDRPWYSCFGIMFDAPVQDGVRFRAAVRPPFPISVYVVVFYRVTFGAFKTSDGLQFLTADNDNFTIFQEE